MHTKPNKAVIGIAAVLVVLMVVGTVWDQLISQTFHDQDNLFGNLLAAFGEAPAGLAFVASGTLLIVARNRERTVVRVAQIVGALLLGALGFVMVFVMPSRYMDLQPVLVVVTGFLLVTGTLALARWASDGADRRVVLRASLMLFLVVLAEVILVNVVKVVWERPRLRFLVENPDVAFQPWFIIGNQFKDSLLAAGVSSEEFKSFPSGHTANAATLMLLSVLVTVRRNLAHLRGSMLVIGAAWGLMVAASRVIMGAHFLTDTVFGFAITFGLVLLAHRFVTRGIKPTPRMEQVTA